MAMAGGNATLPPDGKRDVGVRTNLPNNRTARVFICHHERHLVALHGYIKKTRATPDEDLALVRKRRRELKP
jgi:phage-related protein